MLRIALAEAAVDAVRHDDEVRIGEQALVVHVGLIDEPHLEFRRAFLQDEQEGPPRAAAEPVAADAVDGILEMDRDIVPVGEFLGDAPIARKIVFLEIVERRIGEHDPEPEVSSARLRS